MRIQKIQIMAMAMRNTVDSMQLDVTVFLVIRYRSSTFANLAILSDFFDFFNLATAVAHSLPSIHLILNRPSLVASNTPSDAPEPLFTSDFHRRCREHRCRNHRCHQIPTSGSPHLHPVHMATRVLQDPTGQWYADMGCAICWICATQ